MRFMDLLHADRQVRLAPGEHLADTRITLWIHKHFILQIALALAVLITPGYVLLYGTGNSFARRAIRLTARPFGTGTRAVQNANDFVRKASFGYG